MLDFTASSTLDSRITFTRASSATYFNSSGVLTSAANNAPRFDYDPVTLAARGLLIEEQRTNILLNSLIDKTNLSTQSVATSAVAYTLSFYGTGTVTLSGTSTATLTGTGAFPTRSTLTFTPTAGTLTLTVTGTVQCAQLEAGNFATSFIPTAAEQATRAADSATMTGTNFSSWYNASEGTLFAEVLNGVMADASQTSIHVDDTTTSNRVMLLRNPSRIGTLTVTSGGVTQADISNGSASSDGATLRLAGAYKANDFAASTNGATPGTDTSGTVPTVTQMIMGGRPAGANILNGWLRRIAYYPRRLSNAELQGITT